MSLRNNVILAGIGAIFLAVIGALLSDVFSSLSESLRDKISPVHPEINIIAKVFDNEKREVSKEIESGATDVSSHAVTFYFNVIKKSDLSFWNSPLDYFISIMPNSDPYKGYQYECSFDGQPFEDCSSPKPYGDLPTEVMHIFKVRSKGILGNTADIAKNFTFTSVTSSTVKGIVDNNGEIIKNANITIDNLNNTDQTNSAGTFLIKNIGQGDHLLNISALVDNKIQDFSDEASFFVPRGTEWLDISLSLEKLAEKGKRTISDITNGNLTVKQNIEQNKIDPSKINPKFQSNPNIISPTNGNISIAIESQKISKNLFETRLWINGSDSDLKQIKNVSYYLHPTFKPNILNSTSSDNNFTLNITNWGIFTIKAKVFFNNNEVKDLELSNRKWAEIL
jgi:YEATS family